MSAGKPNPVASSSNESEARSRSNGQAIFSEIDGLLEDFRLNDQTYVDIMNLLEEDIKTGLGMKSDGDHPLKTHRYSAYMLSLPDGTEKGRYLALDLGGTNFRVLLVDLTGSEKSRVSSKLYRISDTIKVGSGKQLFEHIASCMHDFLGRENLLNTEDTMQLGFTFSFPCVQMGLASAKLARWTKGFKCSGVVDHDVVQLLEEAIQARGEMNVKCVAVINDTVGIVMSGAHEYDHCLVGLGLGTGTNCCYVENVNNVKQRDLDHGEAKQVLINTEWAFFGECGCLNFMRNRFDLTLDKHSVNHGQQVFGKMIGGHHMGEIVRYVLCELVEKQLIFGGRISEKLLTANSLETSHISQIESDDPEGSFSNTRVVLQELDIPQFTSDDCRYVQHVCSQVSRRAAYLAATGVATIIHRLDRAMVTVAVDGSLYRFHPHFADLMNKKIATLIKPHQKFQLVLSDDGSGKGAALVAAVVTRCRSSTTLSDPGIYTTSTENPADDTPIKRH